MAMGLGFLGRGKVWRTVYLGILHVLGAALGGAIVGVLLGWLGSLLLSSAWRPVAIVVIAAFALWQSLSHYPKRLGVRRQVPRKWAVTMAPAPRYFLWGMLLGSGVATVIIYSVFLILLVTQLTSGATLGCISGILFGAIRASIALLPLFSKQNRLYPENLPRLLLRLTIKTRQLNILLIVIGSSLLLISSWLWL